MRSTWLLVGTLLSPSEAAAQAARELQVQGVATVTAAEYLGAGLGVAFRGRGRSRIGFTASVGAQGGRAAGRIEGLVSYHLHPMRRRGVTPYAGGGAAVVVTGGASSEYMMVLAGIEGTPGGRRGWFLELGAGGGLRVSAGGRMRWR